MAGKKDYFSVADEPALNKEGRFITDPAERTADFPVSRDDELTMLRDSVYSEPFQNQTAGNIHDHIEARSRGVSFAELLLITLLAGTLGGILAVPGVFLSGMQGWSRIIMLVLLGPLVEEFLKQSGMLYLLEKKPFYVSGRWQFILAALMGGLLFAVCENLIYQYIYLRLLSDETLRDIMIFRWKYCTLLHVGCTLISSFGLDYAWRQSRKEKVLFNFQYAYVFFGIAIAVHGIYNFCAFVFSR